MDKKTEREIWDKWNLASDDERMAPSSFVTRIMSELGLDVEASERVQMVIGRPLPNTRQHDNQALSRTMRDLDDAI